MRTHRLQPRLARPAVSLLLASLSACGGGPGGSASTIPVPVLVPGAPTSVSGTVGNASITLSFAAPASNGGSPITAYSAQCSVGAASTSVSTSAGATSASIGGLVNGSTYACSVSALNLAGTGAPSATLQLTPVAPPAVDGSTAPVACAISTNLFNSSAKVNAQSISSWTCSATQRLMTGNGIPDHAVAGGNFATPISAQNLSLAMPIAPAVVAITGTFLDRTAMGYVLNSVKLDPGTAGSCAADASSTAPGGGCVAANGRDPWVLEAIGGAFVFGTDESNGHVQPNGQYHYHGMPEAYLAKVGKGSAMTLLGFAIDGFPIYARYGYSDKSNAASALKIMSASWQKKTVADPGRPALSVFPMGTFTSDYQYLAGSGDLDECNGRTGVTPEFPNGIYHYYVTDSFPYIQRCIKGNA